MTNNFVTFETTGELTISTCEEIKMWNGTIEWSTDTIRWEEFTGKEISSSSGIIYMRGKNNTYLVQGFDDPEGPSNTWQFKTDQKLFVSGNIETLLDYETVANGEHPTMAEYCYSYMFYNCQVLAKAPELPAMELTDGCYANMFFNCKTLTETPKLPATKLADACYAGMFYKCSSLIKIPELPATVLAKWCYANMFCNCTSLIEVPELPATELADGCYAGMFRGCMSLAKMPVFSQVIKNLITLNTLLGKEDKNMKNMFKGTHISIA